MLVNTVMSDSLKHDDSSSDAGEAYQVLARKYRPRYFDELIGQDALVQTLKNAISTGRIAHAYMLHGVRGVGKTTTARIIAKAINYNGPDGEQGPTTGPTDDCEICNAIAKDRHPDVMEMDAASRTGVEDIREILDGVRYAPVSARYKVYIIDEVHMLSKNAFNALLKTLEEPPPQVIFIFATTEIRKVPVTVLSRCQRFDLKRVDMKTLQDYYKIICDKEGVSIQDTALALIGQAADGSVRDGLSLLDQTISQHIQDDASEISLDDVQTMLGLADRSQMLNLLKCAISGQPAQALDVMQLLLNDGADAQMILQDLTDLVHIISRFCVAGGQSANDQGSTQDNKAIALGPDLTQQAMELASTLSMPSLGRAWDILLKGLRDIQIAPQPEKSAEMTIIRLSYAANLPDPAKLLKELSEGDFAQDNTPDSSESKDSSSKDARATSEGLGQNQAINDLDSMQDQVGTSTHHHAQKKTILEASYINQRSEQNSDHSNSVNTSLPQTLQDVVTLFEHAGKIRLASDIKQFVCLVHFSDLQIEFNPSSGAPKTLANEIQKTLNLLTHKKWIVSITSAQGDLSLAEQERQANAQKRSEVKQHPIVQRVLEAFPGAELDEIYALENKIHQKKVQK